jgi:argininosuccinate lyase
MLSRVAVIPGAKRLLGGLARIGISTPPLETLLATLADPDLVEKLANQAASAAQALEEARALATEAQQDRNTAEAVWREAHRIKAQLEAAHVAQAARSAELDSHVHLIEMQRVRLAEREAIVTARERELEKMLDDVAALKTEYESKLTAIEAIVKGPILS